MLRKANRHYKIYKYIWILQEAHVYACVHISWLNLSFLLIKYLIHKHIRMQECSYAFLLFAIYSIERCRFTLMTFDICTIR